MRAALVLAALLLAPVLSAASFYPDPWKWVPEASPPRLTLSLGGEAFQKTWPLPAGATELTLVLRKFLMTEDALTLQWSSDGQPWLWRQKKIPGDASTEVVRLPPGKQITLALRSVGGASLATITLLRK